MQDFAERKAVLRKEYVQAVYEESSIRESSFLPVSLDIGGIAVKQFTPYHCLLLDFNESPFINPDYGALTLDQIIDFLWVVSEDFKENDGPAKENFIKDKCAALDYIQTIEGIQKYIDDAFLDTPHRRQDNAPRTPEFFYAWICTYIDALAHEYGWDDNKVLHLPFARILQYMKAIEAREAAKTGAKPDLYNNRSGKIKLQLEQLDREETAAREAAAK